MKQIAISFALLFVALNSYAQAVNDIVINEGGYTHITEVVQVPNLSKDDLYSNCIIWLSEHIYSAKNAIQTENQQAGLVTVKSHIIAEHPSYMWTFKLTVQMKDGRYKYDITNIAYCATPQTKQNFLSEIGYDIKDVPVEQYHWKDTSNWKRDLYLLFAPTISSLKKKMAEKSDW